VLAAFVTLPAAALDVGARVDNFKLLDHDGRAHELHYLSDMKAVVLMVHGNGCAAVRDSLPGFRATRDAWRQRGVEFLMIDPNREDTRDSVAAEARGLGIDVPILLDETQVISESLGVERAGEVFVVDTRAWTLAYRGAVDGAAAAARPLDAALAAVVGGTAPAVARTEAQGCAVEYAQRSGQRQVSYAETIAPMLIDKCVGCHHEGGIGPWAMSSYDMVRGFSLMMREVVRTKRMPPWHADPHVGKWANDRSLSGDQVRDLVHWIEAGAPRGDGPDPLAEYRPKWQEWDLDTPPDLVLDVPPFEVPATGVVDYQYLYVKNPLDHDVWVRASQLLPGDRKALHHTITRFFVPEPGEEDASAFSGRRAGRREGGGIAGYVPGSRGSALPEGTGVLLPKGAVFQLQMHYTTYGKASTDRSRIGLWFHEAPPPHRISGTVLINPRLRIPANTKAHSESASQKLTRDVLVYGFMPHAHFRGKSAEYRAIFPDGREEVLLSVPNYDFNWQTQYQLAEPRRLPAGTTLVSTTTWDNSAQNRANPDPNRVVPWGQQTWDEMLFNTVQFRYLDASASTDDNGAALSRFE
jgi:peroxiredoxin